MREFISDKSSGFENSNAFMGTDELAIGTDQFNERADEQSNNREIILKMVQQLSTIGSQLNQLGEAKDCEECYKYYIGVMEILFGENTKEISEGYYWLGQFYNDKQNYDKAKFCFQKTIEIRKQINETSNLEDAEIRMNLGYLLKN